MQLLKGWKDRTKATTLIVRTDAHSGHKLGLQNPDTELWDEDEEGNPEPYKPELTATQKWLWENYTGHLGAAIESAGDDEIVIFDLGDVCQGDKYAAELVSVKDADQVELALGTFEPLVPYAGRIRAIRLLVGTGAHNFGFGSVEVSILGRLKNMFPKTDVKLVKHGLFTISGVTIDAAHHGSGGGSRTWLQGNVLRIYLTSLMMAEIMSGNVPPILVLRAHHHGEAKATATYYSNDGRMWESTIYLVPPYSGMTHYARQVTQSRHVLPVGLLSFRLVNGLVEQSNRFVETIDLRTKEVL